ncbi:hypothetical protein V6N11_071477 [Hibiscus sabdariffa]|uniref:Uncharacterized protein n=1 Tax=Hibiscus sabdariffa TaxID=183260 RepID=A0ABR2U087_9ROSI
MEVDDQSDSLSEGGDTDDVVTVVIEGDGIPPTSYARVVTGACDKHVSDSVPSLDDIVVEAEDVSEYERSIGYLTLLAKIKILWQLQGAFQGLSKDASHACKGVDVAASNDQSRPMPMEDIIYGDYAGCWTLAA